MYCLIFGIVDVFRFSYISFYHVDTDGFPSSNKMSKLESVFLFLIATPQNM